VDSVIFGDYELKKRFLSGIGISLEEFEKKFYLFDEKRKLHIAESERGFFWISTVGLIAHRNKLRDYNNKFVNALESQHIVIDLLIDSAIGMCQKEEAYNVDGFIFGYLNEITLALFGNTLLYYELLCKSYLSLTGSEPPHTHLLSELFELLKKNMYIKKHNNSLFHLLVVESMHGVVEKISMMPGSFKEEYVKYDDNDMGNSVIGFDAESLKSMKNTIGIAFDIVIDYYFERSDPIFLKSGLYERYMEEATTKEKKKEVEERFAFLKDKE